MGITTRQMQGGLQPKLKSKHRPLGQNPQMKIRWIETLTQSFDLIAVAKCEGISPDQVMKVDVMKSAIARELVFAAQLIRAACQSAASAQCISVIVPYTWDVLDQNIHIVNPLEAKECRQDLTHAS